MAIKVVKQFENGLGEMLVEFICDSTADLTNLPLINENRPVPAGSTVFCVEDKKKYILSVAGEWKEYIQAGGGESGPTYSEITQSEIDTGTSTTSMVISPKLLKDNLNNKVDKVAGKTLSTNDFTNNYKEKVDKLSIPEGDILTTDLVKGIDYEVQNINEIHILRDCAGVIDMYRPFDDGGFPNNMPDQYIIRTNGYNIKIRFASELSDGYILIPFFSLADKIISISNPYHVYAVNESEIYLSVKLNNEQNVAWGLITTSDSFVSVISAELKNTFD